MNSKQVLILLVLVVIMGGAGYTLYQRGQSSWQSTGAGMGQKVLGELPVNSVIHIVLRQGTNEVNLARKDDVWCVRERFDYPAAFSQISEFLIKAADLKVVQTERIEASGMEKLGLVPGHGTNPPVVVDLKDSSDKLLKSLVLGKQHFKKSNRPSAMGEMDDAGWPDGRYLRIGADADSYVLVSDALANLEAKPDQWLDKGFLKVERLKEIAVAYLEPTNSWKVSRESDSATEWKLANATPAEKLDSSKTSGLSYTFNSPAFSDVLPPKTSLAPLGLDKPVVVTFNTFDNFTYTLKVGSKTNDNYPVSIAVTASLPKERVAGKDEKPEDKAKLDKEFKDGQKKLEEKLAQEKRYESWVYWVSTWSLEPVIKERAQLMVDKKDDSKKNDAKAGEDDKDETVAPASTNAVPAAAH